MELFRSRYLNDFPYPIAYPYSLVFNENNNPSDRRSAICFTVYQLLRMVCLPLVSQYLIEPVGQTVHEGVKSLNTAIGSIRSPFFSDWIALVFTLAKYLPKVGIDPLFASLSQSLDMLRNKEIRPFGLRGNYMLDPLNAVLALRNETAHGGIVHQADAVEHLESYLPILHRILDAFDFLGDTALKVCTDEPFMIATGRVLMHNLRGAHLDDPIEEDIPDSVAIALEESLTILIVPEEKTVPLYPLFNQVSEREAVYLYDGHYGIHVKTAQGSEERSYIYYLGTHHHATESMACDRLKLLFEARKIAFFLEKDKVAPWTIAESAADYSLRTLQWLSGIKYIPECYVPFSDLDHHFDSFLRIPPAKTWSADTTYPRFINGFILTGLAGAGKTAFLSHQVEKLISLNSVPAYRENPNLIVFLRGDSISVRSGGVSLFADIAEKLGIAIEGATFKECKQGGFSSFRELLEHLHGRWKQDRIDSRRLIIILDALNEAPFAERIIREALVLSGLAACYPWCKVVFSIRQEWLSLWPGKIGQQEVNPFEEFRSVFYDITAHSLPSCESGTLHREKGPPAVNIEPFTKKQAKAVYERYQSRSQYMNNESADVCVPACLTPWEELSSETRELLLNPLYLHLFMETFQGERAESVATIPALFRCFVDRCMKLHPGLEQSVHAVIGHLLDDLTRPGADLSDDDVNAIRRKWAESLTAEEARIYLSPVEGLVLEGWIRKRVREDGGGYRFAFQTVAEYLIFIYLSHELRDGEDELVYWTRIAKPLDVFPEYAGAFGFLLRYWMESGRFSLASSLVENSAPWMANVLTAFLIERGLTQFVPGQGSVAAETAAQDIYEGAGEKTVMAVFYAACELHPTYFSHSAKSYYRTCILVSEKMFEKNHENVGVGNLLGSALNNLGLLLSFEGCVSESEEIYRHSVEISERLCEKNPENVDFEKGLGQALNNLGLLLCDNGRMSESEEVYRRSAEISERLFILNPENVAVGNLLGLALSNLGNLLRSDGRMSEAEKVYQYSVEIGLMLFENNPENVGVGYGLGLAMNNIGMLLNDEGRVTEAEDVYCRSFEIGAWLFKNNPDNVNIGNLLGTTLNNIGCLLLSDGRVSEAEDVYRRTVEIGERLLERSPKSVEVGNWLGLALNDLGNLLSYEGRVSEAEKIYRRSAEIAERIFEMNPESVSVGRGLGLALNNLGNLLLSKGRVIEAEEHYCHTVEIGELLFENNLENIDVGSLLGLALNNLGNLLLSNGRMSEAEDICRRTVEISEWLFEKNPENVSVGNGLGQALNNLGLLLCDNGRVSEAEEVYRYSVEISEQLFKKNSENVGVGNELGLVLNNLGMLLCDNGRVSEAEEVYRRSVEISEQLFEKNPENVLNGNLLGTALNNMGNLLSNCRMPESEEVYRRSVEIGEQLFENNPENVRVGNVLGVALNNLGILMFSDGRMSEAEKIYRRSVEIGEQLIEKNPEDVGVGNVLGSALKNLGLLQTDNGHVSEAERNYRRSVDILELMFKKNPKSVCIGIELGSAMNALGNKLLSDSHISEAENYYRRTIEILENLFENNLENIRLVNVFVMVLKNFGLLLSDNGRISEAEKINKRLDVIAKNKVQQEIQSMHRNHD